MVAATMLRPVHGGRNRRSPWTGRSIVAATIAGAIVGAVIPLSGGRLMGGSLDLLARSFEGSRLRLDQIGAVFGEAGFGPIRQAAPGALEGALRSEARSVGKECVSPCSSRGSPAY